MKLGGSASGFLSSSVAAMEDDILSNLTSASGEHAASASSARTDDVGPGCNKQGTATKKKRGLPCNPDPDAEVVALSPRSLMGTNKFTCEVCNKGFRRDQNLQLHRRGHNLPWKLKQRKKDEPLRRKVYVCPEPTCAHHEPSRALGDLTGIKKHYFRKHGEKRWKCERCEKKYAVRSDWKAHSKVCGTREYKCDCGTVFSRRDSFITHRAFCDALTHETMMKTFTAPPPMPPPLPTSLTETNTFFSPPPATTPSSPGFFPQLPHFSLPGHFLDSSHGFHPLPPLPVIKPEPENYRVPTSALFGQHQQMQQQQAFCFPSPSPNPSASATALLQRATMMGTTANSDGIPLLASRTRAEHESIDLLQEMDMDMNMTATMMMGSIPAEAGLGFGGSSSVDGILDPKGGVGGGSKGATRDFLNLSRGFPVPPQRKVDLVGLRGGDMGVQMHEEDQGGDYNDNDQHQHHIWFTE